MKKLLFISSNYKNASVPVAIRVQNMQLFFRQHTDLHILKGRTIYKSNNIFYRAYNRFLRAILVPDADIIYLPIIIFNVIFLIKYYNIQKVYIQTRPISNFYLTRIIKFLSTDIKIIVDVTDPLVINSSFLKFTRRMKNSFENIENNYFKYIDYLIVFNSEIKEYYSNFIDSKNIFVIPQGIIGADNTHLPINQNINTYELKFIYAGSFYDGFREPFELYNYFIKNKNHYLNIFGTIPKRFYTNDLVNVKFNNRVSQSELYKRYFENDVIVFIDNKDPYQLPGKLYEILATNRTILFIYDNKHTAAYKLSQNYEGILYCKNNADDIEKVILSINSANINRDLSEFTWEHITKQLIDIL